MNFLSWTFCIFFIAFMTVYYIIPSRYRYIPVLAGSLVFYGSFDWHYLLILTLIIGITYMGGRVLEKCKKTFVYTLFFIATLSILIFFKYTNFFLYNINIFVGSDFNSLDIILPVGLSFLVFQSASYLGDVYRKDFPAERNILRYAAFVAFFPTILSGPIQKSRLLLPQFKEPKFDNDKATKGVILFIWGAFVKTCVANRLLVIVGKVFAPDAYLNFNTAYYITAAISFSLYIYADFSSYSDMAQGIAKMMGIEVGRNFFNPYFSTNLSEFWRRWHASLNDWFIENIYIPLGGSRKGKFRKYLNVLIVFFISGLWHGAAWHFVAWGVVNGILVVIGQLICPVKKWFYKKIHVDETCESITFIRRMIVFFLITFTWVFFQNGLLASLHIIRRMVLFSPVNLFMPELLLISGSEIQTVITLVFAIIFCFIQDKRYDEKQRITYQIFSKQPMFLQCLLLGILVTVTIFSGFAAEVTVNTQFLYFNF